jgi:hypothetical protein
VSDKLWHLPVCFTYPASGSGAKLARQCAMVETREARAVLPGVTGCPAFVYANAGEEGYDRLSLTPGRLAPLVRAFGRLPEAERFGVVSNAFAAVRSGELPGPAFLALAAKLRGERSRLVWSEVIDALWTTERALVSDDARPAFARFVRELAGPTARRLGWRGKPNESDDDHFLRESVLHVMGALGEDVAVLAEADKLARKWLAAPGAADGVPSDVARIALPLAAKRGDVALWQQMVAVLKAPPTPEVRVMALSGLIGFDDRALTERTLGLVLDGTIKPQDLRYLFPALGMRRATRDMTLAWIQAHLEDVVPKIPPAAVGRLVATVTGLCDAERVRAFETFMTARTAKLEGVEKDLRQSVEAALRCAALADAQREATSSWLAQRR